MLKLKLQYFGPWCKELTHWKRPWCWERLGAEGEEGIRGWDGCMTSLILRTWTWAYSGRWWGTGRPGMLQSMGSWRVRHNWATEQHQNMGAIALKAEWNSCDKDCVACKSPLKICALRPFCIPCSGFTQMRMFRWDTLTISSLELSTQIFSAHKQDSSLPSWLQYFWLKLPFSSDKYFLGSFPSHPSLSLLIYHRAWNSLRGLRGSWGGTVT